MGCKSGSGMREMCIGRVEKVDVSGVSREKRNEVERKVGYGMVD